MFDHIAIVTRDLHARQFLHRDLFWRNIVVARNNLRELSLIDSPRGRALKRPLTARECAVDLASLDGPASHFFRRTERLRFLLLYLGQDRLDSAAKTLARLVLKTAEPLRMNQWRHMRQLLNKLKT